MSLIEEKIFEHAARTPEKTACVFPRGADVSCAALASGIAAAADFFRQTFPRGEARVLLAAEKTPEFLCAYFGAHCAGTVAVPVDPETNAARLAAIAETVRADAFCGNFAAAPDAPRGKIDRLALPAAAVAPAENFSGNALPQKIPAFPPPDQLADIVFTTGTTSAPKGVCLTHGNLAAAANAINTFTGTCAADTEVVALPICHSFGLGRVRCLLSLGATAVFVNGFAAVKKLFRALGESRATGFAFVPAAWAYLRKMSGEKLGQFAGTLRYIEIGSAPMPIEDKRLLMRLFPNTRICMHYGLTEASRSTFLEFHENADRLDTVGRASPGAEIEIFDAAGTRLPAGQGGEICVRGAHVMRGYLNPPSGEPTFFGERFFRTGDLGKKCEDGFVVLTGRLKEIVNVGGKKVSPQEVEDVLNTFPEIAESACVGVRDESGVLGEQLKACLVPADGAEIPPPEILRERLAARLEAYKIPAIFERVPAIPKTASGKLQRGKLK